MTTDPNDPFNWMARSGLDNSATHEQNLADQEALNEAFVEQRMKLATLVKDQLHTGQGSDLLDHLRQCTIECPLMDTSRCISDGNANFSLTAAEWAYFREGQNSLVRYLEGLVAFALNPPQTKPTQQNESEDNG